MQDPFSLGDRSVVRRFDNRFEIIVLPDSASPVVSVQYWVRSGSMHEGMHVGSGLAHLLEHMVFKGTRSLPIGGAATVMQELGGALNAYTSYDRTVYFADLPAAGLRKAIEVLGELVFLPTLPLEEFEREKDVIRREIAMGRDSANDAVSRETLGALFPQGPLGQPVIGHRGAFERLTHDDLLAFHRTHYTPDHVFLVVAGDADPDEVIEAAGALVGDLPEGMRPVFGFPDESAPTVPIRRQREFATDVSRWQAAWLCPPLNDPAAPALNVIAQLLGGGASSRLHQRLHEELGVAHNASAGVFSAGKYGAFFTSATCDPGREEELENAAVREFSQLADRGITPRELEKASRQSLAAFFEGFSTASGMASNLATGWLTDGTLDFWPRYLAALRALTPEGVRDTAARFLNPEHRAQCRLVPKGSPAAARAKRSHTAPPEPEFRTLENGARLLLLRDTRLPLVRIAGCFPGGAAADARWQPGMAALLSESMLKGTTQRSAGELMAAVEDLGGSLDFSAGNNSFLMGIGGLAEDASALAALAGEVLASPAFPDGPVDLARAACIAAAKERQLRPLSAALSAARGHALSHTAFAGPADGTVDGLRALAITDLRDAHHRLLHPANGVIAIAGDFDAEEMCGSISKWWPQPGGGAAFEFPQAGQAKPFSRIELELDKEQEVVVAAFRTRGLSDPDLAAHQLLAEATGDMSSRLFRRIREDQGLAYYVGPSLLLGRDHGCLFFYLGTSPQQADHAESELLDEIAKMAAEGLDTAETDRARKSWDGARQLARQTAQARAMEMLVTHALGLGPDHDEQLREQLLAITRNDLTAALHRLLATPAALVRTRARGKV